MIAEEQGDDARSGDVDQTSSSSPDPDDIDTNIRVRIGLVCWVLALALAVIVMYEYGNQVLNSTRAACVIYPPSVSLRPGEVRTVDAEVAFRDCALVPDYSSQLQIDEDKFRQDVYVRASREGRVATQQEVESEVYGWRMTESRARLQAKRDALAGSRVRLSLVAPMFDGEVKPVSEEVQNISDPDRRGAWAWQIRADKPGESEVNLVLSVLTPGTNDAEEVNERIPIVIRTESSLAYYAGAIGSGVASFLSSLFGLAISGLAAIAAVYGVLSQARKNRIEEKAEKPQAPSPKPDINPYM